MQRVLEESGWMVIRVKPYFDIQWIAERWLPNVRQTISTTQSGNLSEQ